VNGIADAQNSRFWRGIFVRLVRGSVRWAIAGTWPPGAMK